MPGIAITRRVGAALQACTLTFLERQPIDVPLAATQHEAYEIALRGLGLQVDSLAPIDDLPDSVFIEDTAIVLDELAIITRPGAVARRPEIAHTTQMLAHRCRLAFVDAPATIEGGDVIRLGKRLLVGVSGRTNEAGVHELRRIAKPLGYTVDPFPVRGALHLKSACTRIDDETLLAHAAWIEPTKLSVRRVLRVTGAEPLAANVVPVGDRILISAAFPETRFVLENAGYKTMSVDVSELHKAEGGLTCLSLLF
jgi:dimethylargininase